MRGQIKYSYFINAGGALRYSLLIIKCSKGTFSLIMLLTEEFVAGFRSSRGPGVKLEISRTYIPTINISLRN